MAKAHNTSCLEEWRRSIKNTPPLEIVEYKESTIEEIIADK